MADLPLRIMQVSSSDLQGGAERVAWNLFRAYRSRGHDSKLVVGVKRTDDPDVLVMPNEAARGRWARTWRDLSKRLERDGNRTWMSRMAGIAAEPIRRFAISRGIEDFHFPGTARLLELTERPPDVLHLHNLHGAYFDLRVLPQLSHRVPVLLTLHDAWLLSGHCAHSFDCTRWRDGCGSCPDLTIYPAVERDATAHNWRRKRDIFRQSRLCVSAPSRWLINKAAESMLAPAIVDARTIPNGVDLNVFRPGDRGDARTRLGIPQSSWMLLTTGVGVRDSKWKDLRMLREAVTRASRLLPEANDMIVIALGDQGAVERLGRAELRFVPFRADAVEVTRFYRAADLYLHPARVDTFPSTVLESLACGTPVIATSVGGIPEQLDDGDGGFLVPSGDADAMATRVVQLLEDDGLRTAMQSRAALRARTRYSLESQVDAHLEWYGQMRRGSADKGPIER